MYRIILLLFASVLVACSTHAEDGTVVNVTELIPDDQVFIFTLNGCPHCEEAKNYIKKKYPNLRVRYREISNAENRKYFYACGFKFGLNTKRLGAPLFCLGEHYILGWDDSDESRFDKYIEPFLDQYSK